MKEDIAKIFAKKIRNEMNYSWNNLLTLEKNEHLLFSTIKTVASFKSIIMRTVMLSLNISS